MTNDDVVVGAYGLRTFRVCDDGRLLSPVSLDTDGWIDGTCIAQCHPGANITGRIRLGGAGGADTASTKAAHRVPHESCRCGVYSFRDLLTLRGNYDESAYLVAVIRLEGTVLEGTRGQRAEAARVVALWVSPTALPDNVRGKLIARLPEVTVQENLAEMIAHYPGLAIEPNENAARGTPALTPAGRRNLHATAARVLSTFDIRRHLQRMLGPLLVLLFLVELFRVSWEWDGLDHPDLTDSAWDWPHFLYALFHGCGAIADALRGHSLGWMAFFTVVALIGSVRRAFTGWSYRIQRWWLTASLVLAAACFAPRPLDTRAAVWSLLIFAGYVATVLIAARCDNRRQPLNGSMRATTTGVAVARLGTVTGPRLPAPQRARLRRAAGWTDHRPGYRVDVSWPLVLHPVQRLSAEDQVDDERDHD